MKVEYTEETTVRKALAFEIESEVVEQEVTAKAREYARKVKLPGFRPGKIPTEVIKRRFRPQVMEDVIEAIANRVVFPEIEGRGLKPLAPPKIADLKVEEGQPLTFRALFETLPIVELPDYRGLPAKARTPNVTEETVNAELNRLREEAARFDPVEGRPAAEGDHLVLDVGWKPAEGGEGGQDQNVLVEVGSPDNHTDLNAALLGMSVGETKDVRLVYEPSHPNQALAGKSADYQVTLKAVKTKVLPAADDEFAKDLDLESLAALRDRIRQGLEAAEARRIDREVKNALLDALLARASFEVPEALVERHMNARTEAAARTLAMQGTDPTEAGVDWRRYRASQREDSVRSAKADIILDEIARREGIEATEAELDAEVGRYAERLRKPKEQVRAHLEKEGEIHALRARIREEKTLDLVKADARLTFE
ncbi:MAG TPA: trigger factor [Vicinamibacteria bacterium]|nr:trigger factor [Vicinamibacteria bacterium]